MHQQTTFADYICQAQQASGKENWALAAEFYARSVPLDPSAPLLVQYGHMLKEAGFLDSAVQAYRTAIGWNGTEADAYLHLGHLLKRVGERGEALAAFQALERIPYAPYVRPEIDGLIIAGLKAQHLTRSAVTQPGSEALPSMPEGLHNADAALKVWFDEERARRQRSFEIKREQALGAPRRASPVVSTTVPFELQPVAHLIIEDGVYRATTANPRMRIRPFPPLTLMDLEDVWIEFNIRIETADRPIGPVLLIEQAPGWAEFRAVRLTSKGGGTFGTLVKLRGPLVSLRLDPLHVAAPFSLSDVRLSRLPTAALLARAASDFGFMPLLGSLASGGMKEIEAYLEDSFFSPADDVYARWIERFERESADLPVEQGATCIGFIMPMAGWDFPGFQATVASLQSQTQNRWELVVMLDEEAFETLRDTVSDEVHKDPRITFLSHAHGVSLAEQLTLGVTALECDFVGSIEPGDMMSSDALWHFANRLDAQPQTRIIYCDDDILGSEGHRQSPRFKPDWNVDYAYCHDYVGHAVLFSVKALQAVGGYRDLFPGCETYDLLLRLARDSGGDGITHIAKPLWHNRKPQGTRDILAPVIDLLDHAGSGITAEQGRVVGTTRLTWPMPDEPPHVTIIIPTRDRIDLLERAVQSILDKTDYPNFDIVVVDNGSVEAVSLHYFAEIIKTGRVSILRDDGPFNFSRLNNRAAARAKGSVLALVNNDVEVMDGSWLKEMVPMALDPKVGAVGAKLLYGSGHVQHAGIIGGVGAVAAHGHKYAPDDAPGYMNRLVVQQTVIAVTAACLVVEAEKYSAVGGMDEENLTVAFNDVDMCLKLSERGWRSVFTPWARLYHHESLSRGLDIGGTRAARFRKEAEYMEQKWAEKILEDPFYSPCLTHAYEDFSLSVVDSS